MTLQDILGPSETINVMDIGAACINEVPVYRSLLDQGLAHLNAFEGDERQIAAIRETYGERVSVFNDFLADGTVKTLYLCAEESGMTSLLKPNVEVLKFFNGFELIGGVRGTLEVQTRRLDDVEGLPVIDLLKMDIQGSELSVLEHGAQTLKDCLVIQLEVSFFGLYENQPTFAQIDTWMRAQGYMPHSFVDIMRWSIAPTIRDNNFRKAFNQIVEADIVYVKNPLRLELLSDDQLRKMALIAHYCFQSYDLCVHFVLELIRREVAPADAVGQYFAMMSAPQPTA